MALINALYTRATRLLLLGLTLMALVAQPLPVYAQTEPEPTESATPAANSVSFPGDYVSKIGGQDWQPGDAKVQATDAKGDGVWTLTVNLPGGDYNFKVAINGTWDENYGADGKLNGDNIPFTVPPQGGAAIFYYDRNTGEINLGINPLPETTAGGTEDVFGADAVLHDSRSDLYRTPFGAQPFSTTVTLRLRTAARTVPQVTLLVDSLSGQGGRTAPMRKVVSDGTYDWWEATLNTGTRPDVFSYVFALSNGEVTQYYADDGALDGGPGQVYPTQPASEQGYRLSVYTPGFTAPAWASNAVIYQVFPDRFRNGDPSNDQTANDWFYPDQRGHAVPVTPWNRPVPDPLPQDPVQNPDWYGVFSNAFYGGDLQGVQEKLDYLQALGVTAIYLNPIFDSPSNHRYDGRDYRQVDEHLAVLGDAAASNKFFQQFAAEVEKRGMHLILDGVPNHTSSDSPMFDRYGRYDTLGACEDVNSPYRDWYFFTPAQPAGSGVCAGDTNYTGWSGVSTLPQANTKHEAVIDNWIGEHGIATTWVQTPGVDGWRIDVVPDLVLVNPTFFELFRTAVKAANPDTLLISETWKEKDVRQRVLGDEFDSTMNYRFRDAVLGFLRDGDYTDTSGTIKALTASELDAALRAMQEEYPPAAFSSAMNLISSHDVNRAVYVLDKDGVNAERTAPVNGFTDGRQRLALAAMLQFTLPGAPTVYYGDEVGLAGFGSDPQRADPYIRQPYPWPDAAGYDSLPAWRQQDPELLALYEQLGKLRGQHSFLRTGAWDTLALDDAGLYVYGRKDDSGAAVIALNRSSAPITATVPVTGYLPFGAGLTSAFDAGQVAVGDNGLLEIAVPAMGYAVWTTDSDVDLTAPAPPTVTAVEQNGAIELTLHATDAQSAEFVILRSLVNGGFTEFGRAPEPQSAVFADPEVTNGTTYYYQVIAQAANGMRSAPAATGGLVPHAAIASVTVAEPTVMQHTLSAIEASPETQGIVAVPGVTDNAGAAPGVRVQVGWAPAGSDQYTWVDGTYTADNEGGADIYTARMLPDATGDYTYVWRASTTGGRDWVMSSNRGKLTVYAAHDAEAPNPPFRLDEVARASNQLAFTWRLSRPPDLFGFRVCRADLTGGEEGCATRINLPKATTVYTDNLVTSDHTYTYTVQVVDNAFNVSAPSEPITLTAEMSMVDVTWRVLAPPETPITDTLFIAGDSGEVFGAPYNPALQPMTKVGDNLWEWKATVKDGTKLLYKYTRGSWEKVEQWGSISGFGNRQVEVTAGPENTMLIDDTATDWGAAGPDDHRAIQAWRDPLVKSTEPAADTAGPVPQVAVEFSIMVAATDLKQVIMVAGADGNPVAGTVAAEGGTKFIFTPDQPFAPGVYTATAYNVQQTTPMASPYTWTFTVAP